MLQVLPKLLLSGSTGAFLWSADQVTSSGTSVSDWAGLVTAFGGILLSVVTLVLGLRARKDTHDGERDELLNDLLIEQLLAEREAARRKKEQEEP